MNIDIRASVLQSLKGIKKDELKENINTSISNKEEKALPGLGVLFEVYYKSLNNEQQENLITALEQNLA